MKSILNKLFEHQRLTKIEAKEVLIHMANEKYNTSQMASFLTIFLMRPISVDELSGFREALLELAVKIDLSEFNTIDLCGTGGDGKKQTYRGCNQKTHRDRGVRSSGRIHCER